MVHADGPRVLQVVFNLLDNARKFTLDGGEIRVECPQKGDRLITTISDTGIGIAPDDQPRIVEKFRPADMRLERQAGGVGLGLSLVKAHGGTIGVDSPPGQGSHFWFTLPLAPMGARTDHDDEVPAGP